MTPRIEIPSRRSLYLNGAAIIPLEAKEKVVQRHANGAKAEAFYFVSRKRVGVRRWWDSGVLAYEWATRGKLRHGCWVEFHTNGVPKLEATYFNGPRHGVRIQFDDQGKVIGTSEFRQGDGVDLWFDSYRGQLGEEWHYRKDFIHGIERWWLGRSKLMREAGWWNGHPHGILREWDLRGRLKPRFPQYWVNNEQVTKRQYLNASRSDSTLPEFRKTDNDPRRPFPDHLVVKARKRVEAVRKRIDAPPLVAQIGELNAGSDEVFTFLQSTPWFPVFKEGGTWRISNTVRCRFEQIAPSYIAFEWIDARWKGGRSSRVTFCLYVCGLKGDHACIEFSHVGVPKSSRKVLQRFWMNQIFRPLLGLYGVSFTGHRAMQHFGSYRPSETRAVSSIESGHRG